MNTRSLCQLSRCTQFPESRLFVFNIFPGFACIVTAMKSRTVAQKNRTKFLLKLVRDISTRMTLSFCMHRFLSGIEYKPAPQIPGIECSIWTRERMSAA